ncbi:MAG: glycosyltransferase family 1 protein [Chloroflexota bacterium]|nr:glycosyltransferase family 1 protein [Chloroflexota bacterium]
MRIFETLESSANTLVGANRTWYRNLYEPPVELGHDVFLFPAEEGRRARQRNDAHARAAFSARLLDAFRREHARRPFDLFFAYLMDGMVEPGAIDEIREHGVPTCNFSCNNAHQFDLVDELSPHFDFNLHSEKDARGKFTAIGANALWWPMASNPKYSKPYDVPRTIAASFVGANYALRASYLAYLLENGVDAHAYGPGWQSGDLSPRRAIAKRYWFLFRALIALAPQSQSWASAKLAELDLRRSVGARFPRNMHAPVSDDEMIALYSRSHISLGFLEVYDQHDPSRAVTQHLHLREFEAPMSGALYCTGYMDELAEHFEPDKEVLVYHSAQELLDKMRYYLAHPEEAERIRQAGRARARRDHTYQRRFEMLFAAIGLKKH